MIVDNNMHWMPETLFEDETLLNTFLRLPPKEENYHAEIRPIPGSDEKQLTIDQPLGYTNLNYTNRDVDAAKRIETMDAVRVDRAILRLPCYEEWIDLATARRVNDMMAETVQKNPDRLSALAIVPPWDNKECRDEMERCVKNLGCVGVELAAHYGSRHLDEKEFRPMWKKITELGVPAVIHHTPLPAEYQALYDIDKVRRSLGRNFSQLICITRNIFSGLFEEFPDLRVVHSYLAGGFFAFTGVLNMKKSFSGKVKEEVQRVTIDANISKNFEKYLEKNLYFDMCHASPWGKEHLEFAVKTLGADHVLYGSSYPLRLSWTMEGVDFVRSLDISDAEKSLVLGGTAQKLFKLKS